jgi:protein-S-isoprenylcysteine O-methyltransferase Ste14
MEQFFDIRPGLLNAWTGSALVFLTMMGIMANKAVSKRMTDMSWYTPRDKRAALASMVFMYSMMVFSVWVPLKVGTPWFYAGLAVYIIAFAGNLIAMHNYATTPKDEAIVKGMYRISRNPLYLFFGLMFLGLIVASLSVPLLLIWIVYSVFTHLIILGEERYCLETYPESYKEYMRSVPRYILFF